MKKIGRTQALAAAVSLAVSGVFGCVADAQSLFNTRTDFAGWAILGNNINPVNVNDVGNASPPALNYNPTPGGTVVTSDSFDTDEDKYDGLGSVSTGSYPNNGIFVGGSAQAGTIGTLGSMTATMNAQNAVTNPGSNNWEIGLSQNLMTNADAVAAASGADYFAVDVNAAPGNNATNSYFQLDLYETFNGTFAVSAPIPSSSQVTNGSVTTVYFPDDFINAGTTNFQLGLYFNTQGETNGAANATANFSLSIDNLRVVPPVWNTSGGGNWNVSNNWTTADTDLAPNGQGLEADFLNYVTSNTTVTISETTDIGTILFNDTAHSYTLSATGGGNLTMNMPGVEPALIDDRAGTDTISAPLILATNTSLCVNVVNSGDVLHISGSISDQLGGTGGLDVNGASTLGLSDSGAGGTLAAPTIGIGATTNGLGTVSLESANTYSGGTTVAGGTLLIDAAGALPAGGAVSITGGKLQLALNTGGETLSSLSISAGGVLDVGNNHMIISDAGGSIDATIRAYLTAGYNGGNWNGASATSGTIITSAPTTIGGLVYSIGYADGADGVVSGLSSGQLEIKYTLAGDANLDGKVGFQDFNILAANYGRSNATWDEGDFNYDGKVGFQDFNLLAANYGQSVGGNADVVTAADWAALDAFAVANGITISEVPEPASTGLMLSPVIGLVMRRRRRSS